MAINEPEITQIFLYFYKEAYRCPDFRGLRDPVCDHQERDYKEEWSNVARFLISHGKPLSAEDENRWLDEVRDLGIQIERLQHLMLFRLGRMTISNSWEQDEEEDQENLRKLEKTAKKAGVSPSDIHALDEKIKALEQKRQEKYDEVERECSNPGANLERLRTAGNYKRLIEIMKKIHSYRSGGTLLDVNKIIVLGDIDHEQEYGQTFLNVLCDFVKFNAKQLHEESFNRFRDSLEIALQRTQEKGNPIGQPALRKIMTFWLFMINPKQYLFLRADKWVRLLLDEKDVKDVLEAPFTVDKYRKILDAVDEAPQRFEGLHPLDMIDVQTILYIHHEYLKAVEKKLLPPIQTTKRRNNMQKELDALKVVQDVRQIILYGPPGTGKTRMAQYLAAALIDDGPGKLNASEDEIKTFLEKEVKSLHELILNPA